MFRKIAFSGISLLVLSACSGGSSGSSGGSGGGTPAASSKIIFYTATKINGKIESLPTAGKTIDKADAVCNADSNKPNSSTYKALISTSDRIACTSANCTVGGATENKQWILKANTTYKKSDGTTLGTTNSSGIITGNLGTDLGGTNSVDFAWTGLSSDWQGDSNDCSAWNDDHNSGKGIAGGLWEIGSAWISGYQYGCDQKMSLICVEQ